VNARNRLAAGTALLLAVAGAASGLAWFAVVKHRAEREAALGRARQVLPFETARVTAMRIQVRGEDFRLERSAGTVKGEVRWRIVAPFTAEADGGEVAALLGRLAGLERRAQSAAPGESLDRLRAYGLAAPSARFELELEGGGTVTLALGSDTGFDGTMFVSPTTGEVLVVESRARAGLERTSAQLRARPPAGPAAPAPLHGQPLPRPSPGG
jgi:hypothetical protein